MRFMVAMIVGFLLAAVLRAQATVEAEAMRSPQKQHAGQAEESQPVQPAPPPVANKPDEQEAQPEQVELKSLESCPVGRIVHSAEPRTKRPFSFYVPTSYDKGKPSPLLIAFTGGGIGRKNIMRLWPLAEKHGQVVLTPDTWAVRGPPGDQVEAAKILRGWSRDTGETEVPHYVRDSSDVLRDLKADAEAVRRTVSLVSRSYHIDSKLVVLTGYSGGAWIAYYTGLADPLRYAGVCIRSGNFQAYLVPPNLVRARKLPITVVIGDRDLNVVLAETDKAEEFFKKKKFANFNVERLPNSGHDSRPEVAFNLVRLLQNKLLAERRKRWEGFCKSGLAAMAEGQIDTAHQWFERAAVMERQFGFPARATGKLKEMPDPGGPDGQQEKPAPN